MQGGPDTAADTAAEGARPTETKKKGGMSREDLKRWEFVPGKALRPGSSRVKPMKAILQPETNRRSPKDSRMPGATVRIGLSSYSQFTFEPQIHNRMNLFDSFDNSQEPAEEGNRRRGVPGTLRSAQFPREAVAAGRARMTVTDGWTDGENQGNPWSQPSGIIEIPSEEIRPGPLKLVEFSVALPEAEIVQLAADFTDWDQAPLDMVRFEGGVWSTTVPLAAGIYPYRFLVDGRWYDDPRALRKKPGSLRATKAFVQVK